LQLAPVARWIDVLQNLMLSYSLVSGRVHVHLLSHNILVQLGNDRDGKRRLLSNGYFCGCCIPWAIWCYGECWFDNMHSRHFKIILFGYKTFYEFNYEKKQIVSFNTCSCYSQTLLTGLAAAALKIKMTESGKMLSPKWNRSKQNHQRKELHVLKSLVFMQLGFAITLRELPHILA